MILNEVTIRGNYALFWKGWPSQWFQSKFIIDGIEYNCAEQYMMAEKARLFGDTEKEKKILHSSSPKKQKELGRQIADFDLSIWNKHAKGIVFKGNLGKFNQNSFLRDKLLETKELILVEASPVDSIWGIGLSADHENAIHPEKWPGKNWLGEVLMRVRNEVR